MNRNEEYAALLAELEQVPEALEHTVEKALNRKNTSQRKRRLFGIPAGSLAACFLGFVLLVNLFPPFARACGTVPVLRELAKAVAWSPSLSAAVENEYVQPIGQSQTVNGITATVEYVIVDQKQLNIFFTLDSRDYDNLTGELPEFSPEQPCSVIGCGTNNPPGTLLNYTLDYQDSDVPDSLTMTFGVTTWVKPERLEVAPVSSYEDEMLEPPEREDPDVLAEFTFTLEFDPQFTAQGEVIPVGRTFELDGQTMTITEAEVYPTHVRINVEGAPENTAWLEGLDFYLENERGERFDTISNGVTATGSPDSPANTGFRLESPYFADSRHLTLHITGAVWLDRDMERVRLDLANQAAEKLPEGVVWESADRREGGWVLTFRTKQRRENSVHQVWAMAFYDEAGTLHEMLQRSSSTDDSGYFTETVPLPGYTEDVVWLEPVYSRTVQLETPVTIPIK